MKKTYKIPEPIGDRILVEVEIDGEKAVQSDFIVIPDSVNEDYNKRVLASTNIGKVLKLGNAATEEALLTSSKPDMYPGDYVLFLQNAGISFKHKEEFKMYRLLKRGDIMAIVGEDSDE